MLNQTIEEIITQINIERVKSKDSNKSSQTADHQSHIKNSSINQRNSDQSTKSISPDNERSCRRSLIYEKNNLNTNQKIYRKKWTKNQQQLLCNLIGRYGSDFSFLQTQFPNKTRKQLKKKYQQIHKNKHYLNKIQRIEQSIIRQRRKSLFDEQIMECQSFDQEKKLESIPIPQMPQQQSKPSYHDVQNESQSY